jgi:hypothetical protein
MVTQLPNRNFLIYVVILIHYSYGKQNSNSQRRSNGSRPHDLQR